MRRSTIRLTGVPEGDIRKNGEKVIFKETKVGTFPELWEDTHLQLQEAPRTPRRVKTEKCTPHYTTVKLQNTKENNSLLNITGEKRRARYKGTAIRRTASFSAAAFRARAVD